MRLCHFEFLALIWLSSMSGSSMCNVLAADGIDGSGDDTMEVDSVASTCMGRVHGSGGNVTEVGPVSSERLGRVHGSGGNVTEVGPVSSECLGRVHGSGGNVTEVGPVSSECLGRVHGSGGNVTEVGPVSSECLGRVHGSGGNVTEVGPVSSECLGRVHGSGGNVTEVGPVSSECLGRVHGSDGNVTEVGPVSSECLGRVHGSGGNVTEVGPVSLNELDLAGPDMMECDDVNEPAPERAEPVPERAEPVPERAEIVPERAEIVPARAEPVIERAESVPERAGNVETEPDLTEGDMTDLTESDLNCTMPSELGDGLSESDCSAGLIPERKRRRRGCVTARRSNRQNETVAQCEKRLREVADKKSEVRKKESEDERARRLRKDAKSKVELRQKESEEEKKLRLRKDAENKLIVRADETEEERAGRLRREAENKLIVRADETEEERAGRLRREAENKVMVRAAETQAERAVRLRKDTENKAVLRRNELHDDRVARILANAARQTVNRNRTHFARIERNSSKARRMFLEFEFEVLDLGNFDVECSKCKALYFKTETSIGSKKRCYSKCCREGKISVKLPFSNYPIELYNLFVGNDKNMARKFQDRIRNYNSAFAFASMKAEQQDRSVMPYCYKIQGQIYHTVNLAAHPNVNEKPSYAQLFFIDTQQALDIRMENRANEKCNREIMAFIDQVLQRVNPFCQSFRFLKEIEDEENEKAVRLGKEPARLKLVFDLGGNVDKRRYNIPKSNEVAAVFILEAGDELPPADSLCIHRRVITQHGKRFEEISKFDPRAEPMTYPLFMPTGCFGGHVNMIDRNGTKLTFNQYYRNLIAIRKPNCLIGDPAMQLGLELAACKWQTDQIDLDGFNPMRLGKKLYQQFLVDAYVKVEQDRLDYIKKNQTALKVENYKALQDYLATTADNQGKRVGKTIILPSSFKGGPRNFAQNYQDCMAMVRRYGKPDLFVTFTCNPNWPEIKRNLLPGNSALDEPDLICRVFAEKLKALLKDFRQNHVFGEVVAFAYVVEFQKRGLPHAHILLILGKNYKFNEPMDIDMTVTAEIPDQTEFPRLYEIVTTHMVHGPCGAHNPKSPCMGTDKKGSQICTKKFPREFVAETSIGTNSYAVYRRRDNGSVIEKGGVQIDNRWIVPYNPYLSLTYNAHINVEICASVKSVKYLFKYVYKGHDCARMAISPESSNSVEHDEVTKFVNMRYVTPHEAFWRIYELKMDDKSHAIIRLDVHLPNEQLVYYKQGDDIRQRVNDAEIRNTTLTAWFALNKTKPEAKKYLYHEIPEYYTYKKSKRVWDVKGGLTGCVPKSTLGRMYSIHPKMGELFYLRTLLLHVKGAESWEDLLITTDFDNDPLPKQSFRDAVNARGLLDSNIQWEEYFEELKTFAKASQIRELFVSIITHGENVNAKAIWEQFKYDMYDDFIRIMPEEEAEKKALILIQKQLETVGNSLVNYGIEVPAEANNDDEIPWDPIEEMGKGEKMRQSMNSEQEEVVKFVLEKVEEMKKGVLNNGCVYIDGPGGSGKTYTYQTICHLLRGFDVSYKTSAYMGIAANLLPDGRTMHKTFALPFCMNKDSVSNAKPNNRVGKELLNTKVFIIDEISMVPKYALTMIDRKLRELTEVDLPFGGKIMIIGGDFRQILPVEKNAGRHELAALSVRHSNLWRHFTVFKLKENKRAATININTPRNSHLENFANWILKVGDGRLSEKGSDMIEIPDVCRAKKNLIDEVFGEMIEDQDYVGMCSRVILTITNERVLKINNEILSRLGDSEAKTYKSMDKADSEEPFSHVDYPQEFLNSINESGLPPHELKVRVNSPVMLKRNLNPAAGLCNGTRLIVKGLHRNHLECEFLLGQRKGERVLIPRITLTSAEGGLPFKLYRRQFPVTLCYAMTINKSQGQTIDYVGLDLVEPVFSHGMTYVAMSRVRSWDCLRIDVDHENEPSVKNIVWEEVLLQDY